MNLSSRACCFQCCAGCPPFNAHPNLWRWRRYLLISNIILTRGLGHSHIRDCQQYDGRSMALESGRYMETIGV